MEAGTDGAVDARGQYRTLRLCSGGGGFEAIPRTERRIDLSRLRATLESEGVPTVDARVMLIATLDAEATISTGGRILIKTSDARLAERTFARVLSYLPRDLPPRPPRGIPARSG